MDESERNLADLPARADLRERLGALRRTGTIAACEDLLTAVAEARLQAMQQLSLTTAHQALADRVLALRLAAEHLRPVAEAERRGLRKAADELDLLLDTRRLRDVEDRLRVQEDLLARLRARDPDVWLSKEAAAREALRQAQAIKMAIDEDEGFSAVIARLGLAATLSRLAGQFSALETQMLAGQFTAVEAVALGLKEKLAQLRDQALEAVRREGIESIVRVAQQCLAARGFGQVRLTRTGDIHEIQGQRGETSLWVQVDGDACLTFDLGSRGFASQRECFAEIDAFLQYFREHGVLVAGMRSQGKRMDVIPGAQEGVGPGETSPSYVQGEPLKLPELEG